MPFQKYLDTKDYYYLFLKKKNIINVTKFVQNKVNRIKYPLSYQKLKEVKYPSPF